MCVWMCVYGVNGCVCVGMRVCRDVCVRLRVDECGCVDACVSVRACRVVWLFRCVQGIEFAWGCVVCFVRIDACWYV